MRDDVHLLARGNVAACAADFHGGSATLTGNLAAVTCRLCAVTLLEHGSALLPTWAIELLLVVALRGISLQVQRQLLADLSQARPRGERR